MATPGGYRQWRQHPGIGRGRHHARAGLAGHARNTGLERLAQLLNTDQCEDYAAILAEGRILAPLDHPDPAHCRVRCRHHHLGSATTRDKMHRRIEGDELDKTDTQLMIEWGIAGGRPRRAAWAFSLNGFTKAMAIASSRPASPCRVLISPLMAAKNRRSSGST
jgi:hypothetical protein